MSIEIKITNQTNHCKISLVGRCTIYTVSKLKESFIEVIAANQNILIDLEKVTDFDTAGLQLFIAAKNMGTRENKKIKFISHPVCIIALFDLYGLTSFFGDKIILTAEEKEQFVFSYGIKKLPSYIY
ncbi:MAG: STAS domain-containing protein [Leptospiraceae bacterium]|nr:STAS domain-containing protein [Leptospiraceae bacterium]